MTLVVALTGYKQSGKDEVGKCFLDNGFELVKFAEPMKEMVRVYLRLRGADEELIYRLVDGDLKETPHPLFEGKTSREAQQFLGTEWGRELLGDEIWVNAWTDRVITKDRVLCTDLRFPNELEAVRKFDGFAIRVNRPEVSLNKFSAHDSEKFIPTLEVYTEIMNDGTLDQLHFRSRDLMEELEEVYDQAIAKYEAQTNDYHYSGSD